MSETGHDAERRPAPRLHVIVAREHPSAVVFRRGPSSTVGVFGWNLKTDAFNVGQWMRARLYVRRCDLSPNGKHLIYFAYDGRSESETRGSWTAISRAPYLKALTIYAKGDAWNGGGLFLDDKSYLLNERYPTHDLLRDSLGFSCARGVPPAVPNANNECLGVYYPRLWRDNWVYREALSHAHIQVFEKPWSRNVKLRKYCHRGKGPRPGGFYTDSHALVRDGEELFAGPLWEWADIVGRRLAWAEAGVLYAAFFDPDLSGALAGAKELHDFNDAKFEALAAPY